MSYPGAGAPPQGVTPNLDNPTDVLRTVNYVTQGLTLFFVTGFVAARCYARTKVLRGGWAYDDYATYIAYLLFLGYCITGTMISQYGGGLNQWEVSKTDIVSFFKTGYAVTIFYAPMALFLKLALLVIIARVFGPVYKKTTMGIYVFMGLLICYYTAGLIVKIRICWPISAYWMGETDKCLNQSAIITADAIISFVSDMAILMLPTPLTWSLQLPMKKKLRVIGILCAGGTATAFSVYRLGLIMAEGHSTNQTIIFLKVILSGNAEAGIGLICACLPAVTALVVRRKQGTGYYSSYSASKSLGNTAVGNGTNNGANNGHPESGQILVNRQFHVSTSPMSPPARDTGSDNFEMMGQDNAELVANAQANPKSKSSIKDSMKESRDSSSI